MNEQESDHITGLMIILCFLVFILVVVMEIGMFVDDYRDYKSTQYIPSNIEIFKDFDGE